MLGAVAKGIGGAIVGEVAVALALNTSGFDKDVKNSVKGAEKSYNNAFNGIGNAGAAMFSKLGKLALAFGGVGALISFGKQAIKLGSDLQEVQNVVDVTFGSMSGAVNEFSQEAITNAGLSETVAKKYMGTYGAMSKAFGFTTEKSYEMSAAITQLTGDVASFYNMSSDEAATKLKSIWTGETETLKELGVVMTQNALDQYALANGYGKTTAKMTEQEKVALRYAFVQDKLSLASGDFIRTQDGWANQTRVLTLRFQQFMATVGQGLINVLTPLVKMLNLLMSKLQGFANAFKNFTASLFGDANSGSGGITSTTTSISDGLSGIGTSASDSASAVKKASKEIKRSLAGVDELNILNTSKNEDTGTGGGSGIGDVGSSGLGSFDVSEEVNGTGGALSKLADKIKELMKPLQDIDFTNLIKGLDKVKTALKPITKKLGAGLEWLWYEILVPLAKWTIEDAVPSFLNAIAGALNFFNGVMDYAKPYLQYLWVEFLQPIASWTGGVIVDIINGIGDGLSKVGDFLTEHAPTLEEIQYNLDPFTNSLKEFWKVWSSIMGLKWDWFVTKLEFLWLCVLKPIWDYLLQPLMTQFWSKLQGLATILASIFQACNLIMEGDWVGAGKSIVDGLIDGVERIWNGSFVKQFIIDPIFNGFGGVDEDSEDVGGRIIDGIGRGLGNLKEWAKKKLKEMFGGFGSAKSDGTTVGENIVDGIGSGLGSLGTKIKEAFKNAMNGAIETVEKAINYIIKQMNKLSWEVPSWVPGIGGKKWGFNFKTVTIPRLFEGGWLPANNPQLAIVGDNKREAEIVAPESKIYDQVAKAIKDTGGTGGKQQLEITIYHKYEDGRTIIQKVNQAQIDAGEVLLLT